MTLAVRFLLGISLAVALQQSAMGQHSDSGTEVFARYGEFQRWSDKQGRLLEDLSDSKLDAHSLFDAALIVAGHNQQAINSFQRRLDESIDRCRTAVAANSTRQAVLRAVFGHLSNEFLRGKYRADLYDVAETIDEGDFNCLTATILFQSICKAFSIEVVAIWEPSHVQCWCPTSDSAGFLVETTASSPEHAVSALTATSRLENRRLTAIQLLAKVFYNRGVVALTDEDFSEALIHTWACCVLDANDLPGHSNLRACLNNWAISASQAGDLELVRKLLDAGIALDPTYEPFARNRMLLLPD